MRMSECTFIDDRPQRSQWSKTVVLYQCQSCFRSRHSLSDKQATMFANIRIKFAIKQSSVFFEKLHFPIFVHLYPHRAYTSRRGARLMRYSRAHTHTVDSIEFMGDERLTDNTHVKRHHASQPSIIAIANISISSSSSSSSQNRLI